MAINSVYCRTAEAHQHGRCWFHSSTNWKTNRLNGNAYNTSDRLSKGTTNWTIGRSKYHEASHTFELGQVDCWLQRSHSNAVHKDANLHQSKEKPHLHKLRRVKIGNSAPGLTAQHDKHLQIAYRFLLNFYRTCLQDSYGIEMSESMAFMARNQAIYPAIVQRTVRHPKSDGDRTHLRKLIEKYKDLDCSQLPVRH